MTKGFKRKGFILLAATCLLIGGTVIGHGEILLETIPGPDDTGGMVMPLVSFNLTSKMISVNLSQGSSVTMYSLQDYEVWGGYPYSSAVFDPVLQSREWYDLLDPTRQNLPFSTRFGFEVISGNGYQLPESTYVYIKATSVSDGLKIYDVGYWADVWEQGGGVDQWMQVYGEGNFGSTIGLDNIAAWGDRDSIKMWHPVAISDGYGTFSATFEIYLGDGYGDPVAGWTGSSPFTLTWVAVPEPTTAVSVLISAGVLLFTRRKRRSICELG